MTRDELALLLHHLVWADRTVIESLRTRDRIPQRAQAVLAHLLAAEQVWLCRINGEPARAMPLWGELSLADCQSLSEKNAAELRALLDSRTGQGLREDVTYTNSKGERFTSSVQDILIHLCMHGSYHRGQIASLVRAGGGEPVNTDYIRYVRSERGRLP